MLTGHPKKLTGSQIASPLPRETEGEDRQTLETIGGTTDGSARVRGIEIPGEESGADLETDEGVEEEIHEEMGTATGVPCAKGTGAGVETENPRDEVC
jgi:hypothetical protein